MVAHAVLSMRFLSQAFGLGERTRPSCTTERCDSPTMESTSCTPPMKEQEPHLDAVVVSDVRQETIVLDSPSAERRLRKGVQFQVDDRDNVVHRVHYYDAVPTQYRRDLYLSKMELQRMRRERRACVATYTLMDEYVFSIERLMDSPLKCHLIQNNDLTEQDAIATITEAGHVRGLESRLSRLIQWHHKWAMKTVLDRHGELCRDSISHPEILLRAVSEHVSECSRDFAFKLAQGDRLEALKVYQEC